MPRTSVRIRVEDLIGTWSSRYWVVTAGSAAVCGLAAGIVPAVLGAASGWVLAYCWRVISQDRVQDAARTELATVVAALAEEYEAGATTAAAFESAAAAAQRYGHAFARAAASAAAGGEVSRSLDGDSGLTDLGVACAVASRTGCALNSVLDGVRADLEADRSLRRVVGAALTGPTTSALLLALLPLVGLVMGFAMGADPLRVLLHTKPGLAALSVGVCLDLTGLMWTLSLTRRASP
jgi:tight adherence protein B